MCMHMTWPCGFFRSGLARHGLYLIILSLVQPTTRWRSLRAQSSMPDHENLRAYLQASVTGPVGLFLFQGRFSPVPLLSTSSRTQSPLTIDPLNPLSQINVLLRHSRTHPPFLPNLNRHRRMRMRRYLHYVSTRRYRAIRRYIVGRRSDEYCRMMLARQPHSEGLTYILSLNDFA